jgi:hypothetical protein
MAKPPASRDFCKLNIRTTTSHVGRNGNRSRFTCLGYNFGFALVLLGIQYIVFDVAHLKHPANQFLKFQQKLYPPVPVGRLVLRLTISSANCVEFLTHGFVIQNHSDLSALLVCWLEW